MFAGAKSSPSPASMLDLEFSELSDVAPYAATMRTTSATLPTSEVDGRTHGWLFALADGVGGEELGEVASQTAIESLIAGFRAAPRGEAHTVLMPRLVQSANTRIYELGKAASPGGSRMATTVVACGLRYDRVVVAHVGDSRCYLIRRGAALQVTRDHTVVAEQVHAWVCYRRATPLQPRPRHLLSRSLGNDLFVNVEIDDRQVQVDDILLLCSDGLHGPVQGSEIGEIVKWSPDLETAARKLIALANDRDGGDNVSGPVDPRTGRGSGWACLPRPASINCARKPTHFMTAIHPGDLLDHYRIESLIARSGMASIWRATDTLNDRPVAIKIPHPEMEADPNLFERFKRGTRDRREARSPRRHEGV